MAEIAEQEGQSISDLVREIVQQHLAERHQQAQRLTGLQALERLTQIRARLQEEHGMYQSDPLAEVRAEQEGSHWVHWIGEE